MDPDQLTRQIPATPPPPPRSPGPQVAVQDDRLVLAELADRVRSLRGWLALATVLALLGVGLAAWALLTQEEEQDAEAGASREQVDELDARVDDLESRLDDRATKNSVSELRSDQEELGEQVEQLGEDAGKTGDTDALEQNIETLDENMQQLQQRLDELEQQQAQQPPE